MDEVLRTSEVQAPAALPDEIAPLADAASDEKPGFFCIVTDAGTSLEAEAHAAKKPVRLAWVAVGDGGGEVPAPDRKATALVHEVYRKEIDSISKDEVDPNIAWLHTVIGANIGGFWIREFGVYAEGLDGGEPVLYAVGNHTPYYKLKTMLGQAITHELSIPLILSSAADVEVVVADVGYATRLEILHLSGIVEALRHPRQAVWTTSAALASGSFITLPGGLKYAPGQGLLQLDWDGLALHPGAQFEEVEEPGSLESGKVKILFAAPAGSEFHAIARGYSLQPTLPEESGPAALTVRLSSLERQVQSVASGAAYVNAPE